MSIEEQADLHYWRAHELSRQDRLKEAMAHLEAALDIEPRHVLALLLAGDIALFDGNSLAIEEGDVYAVALQYYERALSVEPWSAECWADKALALLYLNRNEEALTASEVGLTVLPLGVGWAMSDPDVHTNVAESLFDVRIRALLRLERREEARVALSEGLAYCPGSSFLSDHLEDFVAEDIRGRSSEDGQ